MRAVRVLLCLGGFLAGPVVFSEANDDVQSGMQQAAALGIDLGLYADAERELREQVSACGPGVVDQFKGENRCSHTIKLDDYFLKPTAERTGYLHDDAWPWADGVEFLEPSDELDIPAAWDLKDIGPMTDIHHQQCGDCWSTSSRKLLEQAMATHGVRDEAGDLVLISGQTTLSSCCSWCGSCSGGYMSTPNFFTTDDTNSYGYGLPTRGLDPYQGRNSSCRFNRSQLESFAAKLVRAPYVGSSLAYSRYFAPGERSGPKVENTQRLMMQYKSNALVTIDAIAQSGGVITNCSSINAGGNHMQNIVGWYEQDGLTIARVQNSWGTGHGQEGYTHIRWECGEQRYNRGLGMATRIGIFAAEGVCSEVADAFTGPDVGFVRNSKDDSVILGRPSNGRQTCEWIPQSGIQEVMSADGCQVRVSPEATTEYHLIARSNSCGGKMSSMVLVTPKHKTGIKLSGNEILTPHGTIRM